MIACSSPSQSHVSLPMNLSVDVLAGDNNIIVIFICLAMLSQMLVMSVVEFHNC